MGRPSVIDAKQLRAMSTKSERKKTKTVGGLILMRTCECVRVSLRQQHAYSFDTSVRRVDTFATFAVKLQLSHQHKIHL